MSHPRFSISTLMAVVSVLALELAAGDAGYLFPGMEWHNLLNYGARPMACILGVGLFVLLTTRSGGAGERRFLAGFEVFGVAALFFYIACGRLFTHSIHEGVGDQAKRIVSSGSFLFGGYVKTVFLLPQILVAMLGGWLNTRYRVSVHIERRQAQTPEPMYEASAQPLPKAGGSRLPSKTGKPEV